MNEFCAKIAEILDVPLIKETDVLADFADWDSLSVLSTIAMLDSEYGLNLQGAEVKDIRTVTDLWNLVQSRKKS